MKKLFAIIFSLILVGSGCNQDVPVVEELEINNGPLIEVSMNDIIFGEIPIGSSANDQALKIKNSGTGELNIESVQTTGDFSAKLAFDRSLSAGDLDYLIVGFAPTISGVLTGTLTIKPVDAEAKIINLTGTGLSTSLFISPKTINFDEIIWLTSEEVIEATGPATGAPPRGSSHSVITVKNIGSKTLTSLVISNPDEPTDIFKQTNTCPKNLEAGETCFITVTFTPNAVADFTGKYFVSATGAPTATIILSGQATADPSIVPATEIDDILPKL